MNCTKLFNKISKKDLSKETGIPLTTIYSWEKADKIPEWREHQIAEAAVKLNIDISDCKDEQETN